MSLTGLNCNFKTGETRVSGQGIQLVQASALAEKQGRLEKEEQGARRLEQHNKGGNEE